MYVAARAACAAGVAARGDLDRAAADRHAFPEERVRKARSPGAISPRPGRLPNPAGQQPRHRRPHSILTSSAETRIIQMRLKLDGSFEVYRVVARGVRLRGKLVHGKVSWGQIDKLLPPPSNKPFRFRISSSTLPTAASRSATPFGPVGIALEGNGRLSGGFKGRVAVASPRADAGPLHGRRTSRQPRGRRSSRAIRTSTAGHPRELHLPGEPLLRRYPRGSTPRPASTRRSPASTAAAGWRSAR